MRTCLIALGLLVSATAMAQTTDADLRAAAERYEAVAGIERMLSDTNTSLASRLPQDLRQPFIDKMNELVDAEGLRTTALNAMTKHFTTEELNALATFYGTEIGQSILGKFGAYNAEVTPKVMQDVLQAAETARIELNE